jgi:hypothetical protein
VTASAPTVRTRTTRLETLDSARWLVRLLLEGTDALKTAIGENGNTSLLAKWKTETPEEFKTRKGRSVLYDFLGDVLEDHAGRIFRVPPAPGEDVPAELRGDGKAAEGWLENVDAAGNHLSVFGQRFYTNAKKDGLAAILVDRAPAPPGETNKEQEKKANRRPYWVLVTAGQVLEATYRTVNGRERLALLRYKETVVEKTSIWDPGTEKHRVRVFYDGLDPAEDTFPPGHPRVLPGRERSEELGGAVGATDPRRYTYFEVYELRKTAEGQEIDVLISWGAIKPLTTIPVAVLNLNPQGSPFEGLPPRHVQAVAEAELEHFQNKSEARAKLSKACLSVVHRSGHTPDAAAPQDSLTVNDYFWDTDPQADMKFVEPSPATFTVASADLKRIEDRIKELSDQPLMPDSAVTTKEDAGGRAAKARSRLEWEAMRLVDALEKAMDYTMQHVGKPAGSGGSLVLNREELTMSRAGEFTEVREIRKLGVIGDRTVIEEAKRRGILNPERDTEEYIEEKEAELPRESVEGRVVALEERMRATQEEPRDEPAPREEAA